MLTHRNLLMNAFYVGQRLRYTADDRVCVPVPFYHCFGCVLGTLVCVVHGATIVVPAGPRRGFDARGDRTREMHIGLWRADDVHRDARTCRFPDSRHVQPADRHHVGRPCPLPLMQEVVGRMGMREICIGYGQTEASPIITFTSVDDPLEVRCATVGKPIPGVEVKLVDPVTRTEPPPDQPGELCARGHDVMAGYYNNPQATARAIDAEGWLHTGDLARRRDDGNYRIVGRLKEMINRGGEKIYPPEVEEFLHHHPDVADVAVAGLPNLKVRRDRGRMGCPEGRSIALTRRCTALLQGADHPLQDPRVRGDRVRPSKNRDRQGAEARPQRADNLRTGSGRRRGDRDGVSARIKID